MTENELLKVNEYKAQVQGDSVVDPFEAIAKQRADKILKKNRREIDRLKLHAEKCLFELNREGYIYAIGKIRTIIRKPLDQESLGALYDTSVERLIALAKEAAEQKQ